MCSSHLQNTHAWSVDLGCVPLNPTSQSPSWPCRSAGLLAPGGVPIQLGEEKGCPSLENELQGCPETAKPGPGDALKSVFPRAHQLKCCLCFFRDPFGLVPLCPDFHHLVVGRTAHGLPAPLDVSLLHHLQQPAGKS